jgi:hypothetical protein
MPNMVATADQRAIMFDVFEHYEPEIMVRKKGLAARVQIQLQEMNVPMKLKTLKGYMQYYARIKREGEESIAVERRVFIAEAHS